jgi:hypothetical protein
MLLDCLNYPEAVHSWFQAQRNLKTGNALGLEHETIIQNERALEKYFLSYNGRDFVFSLIQLSFQVKFRYRTSIYSMELHLPWFNQIQWQI